MFVSAFRRINFKIRILAGLLLITALVLASWAFVFEPNRLVVRETTIALSNWPAKGDGLRIAAISDLHAGARWMTLEKLHQIVQQTNAQNPDLIVLLGDYVTNTESYQINDQGSEVVVAVRDAVVVEPDIIASALKNLRARYGVFAVLGNHDWWYNGKLVTQAFENAGIRVLENQAVSITHQGQEFWLAGIGDYWTLHHNLQQTLSGITNDNPVIALTHTPDVFPELPARFNLLLAGHTHGGQVNFPIIGRLVVPSRYKARYAIGHIEEQGRHLFVTPGIGTSIMPVRFRVPPEISVLNVVAQSSAQNE